MDTSKIGPRLHRSALRSVYCMLALAALRARAISNFMQFFGLTKSKFCLVRF